MNKICKNCKHWEEMGEDWEEEHKCDRAFLTRGDSITKDQVFLDHWYCKDIPENFGCKFWEEK